MMSDVMYMSSKHTGDVIGTFANTRLARQACAAVNQRPKLLARIKALESELESAYSSRPRRLGGWGTP